MRGGTFGLHIREGVQTGVVVFPQPSRIDVKDMFDPRHPALNLDHLVDLLLVARDDEARAAMLQHIGHLFGHRVLVERNRNRSHHLRRDHRPVEHRTVAADDGDVVAAPDPECQKTRRQIANLAFGFGPGPALPDAVFLFPVGRAVGKAAGVPRQKRRNGHEHLHGLCGLRHDVLPNGWPGGDRPLSGRIQDN